MHAVTFEKPIGFAIAASITAHLLVGAGVLWLLGNMLQPSATERLLVISFKQSSRDNATTEDSANDAPTARRSATGAAATAAQAGLRMRAPARTDKVERRPEPVAELPENSISRGSSPADAVRLDFEIEQVSAAPPSAALEATDTNALAEEKSPFPVSTVVSERAVAMRPIAEVTVEDATMRISPSQKQMLNKQIRNWQNKLHKMLPADGPVRWTHKGQPYEAHFSQFPARGDTELDKVVVEVLTERDGETLRTQMQMKMLAFSHFAQFVNRWDENVQVHDDTLDGRFHSNSTITLAWDRKVRPRFLGKVTTASRKVRYGDIRVQRRRDEIFAGGLETGVRSIPLAQKSQLPDKSTDAVDRVVFNFEDHAYIRFSGDGSFAWRGENDTASRRERIGPGSTYLVAGKGKTLYVSGEVKGNVTVYSPAHIVIVGNLTYAPDGMNADASSFLGLIAGKNVEIAEPAVTGPGPLAVHAAIYAGKRFKIRRFREREFSQLYIYGSLTAGSISASEPRFSTHIEFDRRLEDRRPAGFPRTSRYELTSWDGEWTRHDDPAAK